MSRNLFAVIFRDLLERLFGDGQHPAGTARAVVKEIGSRLDLLCDRKKNQLRHELYRVAGRPVLTSLFVIFFIESPNEFLEDRPLRVIFHASMLNRAVRVFDLIWTQIDQWIEKLLNQ